MTKPAQKKENVCKTCKAHFPIGYAHDCPAWMVEIVMKKATKEQNKTLRVSEAISDIALQMVKRIANEYIDVEDTSSGRSAQRFWYEHGIEMLRAYVRKLELAYKK